MVGPLGALASLWSNVDVTLKKYAKAPPTPPDAEPMVVEPTAPGESSSKTAKAKSKRYDRYVDPAMKQFLGIAATATAEPASSTPTPSPPPAADKVELLNTWNAQQQSLPSTSSDNTGGRGGRGGGGGRGSRGGGGPGSRGGGRGVSKRVREQCKNETRACSLIKDLKILGRGDVQKKRDKKRADRGEEELGDVLIEERPGMNAATCEGMRRSQEFAKRENRPLLICEGARQLLAGGTLGEVAVH